MDVCALSTSAAQLLRPPPFSRQRAQANLRWSRSTQKRAAATVTSYAGGLGSVIPARPMFQSSRSLRRGSSSRAEYLQVRSQKVDIADRAVAALPYLLPLFDGLRYGKFFFMQFPAFRRLLAPLSPLINLYFSVPFASVAVFFAIYMGIVNNRNFSRFTRFNAMQAVLLDILLLVPSLLESVVRPPSGGAGLQIYVSAYNTCWLFTFCCVAYGVAASLTGTSARLPLIADAADNQVR